MVVIATMAVLVLASTALLITVNSRQITARYGYHVGLYNMAVAGNEQVLHLLNRAVYNNRAVILLSDDNFTQAAMPFAIAGLREYFDPYLARYRRDWETQVCFSSADETILRDKYTATTIVSVESNGFFVRTQVWKYTNGNHSHYVLVTSRIQWPIWPENYPKNLDYYTLEMVELMRIAD